MISYTVAQQTQESGIRMALGAQTAGVLKLILGHGAVLTATGIALGSVAAVALTRLMPGLLFNAARPIR